MIYPLFQRKAVTDLFYLLRKTGTISFKSSISNFSKANSQFKLDSTNAHWHFRGEQKINTQC